MMPKVKFTFMVILLCMGGGFVVLADAQECTYRDEYGESLMHTGGSAIAAGIAMINPSGTWGIPDNYDNWDLNADGIPDRVEFELLTNILCMSNVNLHPTVDLDEIRATYEENLTMYWDLVTAAMAVEAAICAGGPDLRQVGLEIQNAASAAGIQDDLLPADVFGGTIPDAWVGTTWQDLGDILYETGADITWMVTNNWIGSPSSAAWLLLNNTATAYTMAALMGIDENFTSTLFNLSTVQILRLFLTLNSLDWSYILGELLAYGLTATTVANAENSISAIGLDESMLPPADIWTITSNGEEALDGSVLWGESTLLDIYNNNGGDSTAIWEDILDQLPDLPIGSAGALFAMAASCALSGMFILNHKRHR